MRKAAKDAEGWTKNNFGLRYPISGGCPYFLAMADWYLARPHCFSYALSFSKAQVLRI